MNKPLLLNIHLGRRPYRWCLKLQQMVSDAKVAQQRRLPRGPNGVLPAYQHELLPDFVLSVVHTPGVFTVGKRPMGVGHFRAADGSVAGPVGACPYRRERKALLPDEVIVPPSSLCSSGDGEGQTMCALERLATLAEQNKTVALNQHQGAADGSLSFVKVPPADAEAMEIPTHHAGVEVVRTRRGGGVTYHGPGQLTAYPIVNCRRLWAVSDDHNGKGSSPLRWYTAALERAIISMLREEFAIESKAMMAGVWARPRGGLSSLDQRGGKETHVADGEGENEDTFRKVTSIGLQVNDWVTMHGVSINVEPICVPFFEKIVMCELPDKKATSVGDIRLQNDATLNFGERTQHWAAGDFSPLFFHHFQKAIGIDSSTISAAVATNNFESKTEEEIEHIITTQFLRPTSEICGLFPLSNSNH